MDNKWQRFLIELTTGWAAILIALLLIEHQSLDLPVWIVILTCSGAARVGRTFRDSVCEVFRKDIR